MTLKKFSNKPDPLSATWKEIPPREPYHKLITAYSELLKLPEIAHSLGPDHLKKTPIRVVKALSELLSGYTQNPVKILNTSFNAGKYNEMIIVNDIEFTSLCAHHILPFMGKVHFAYIPRKNIVGLSKIPRLVEAFSRRLQLQENLAVQLVDTFQKVVKPLGCAVVIEAHHLCMSIRGVRKERASMRTNALRGIFLRDPAAKAEFFSSINSKGK